MAAGIGYRILIRRSALMLIGLWSTGCLQAERTNPIDSNPAILIASRPVVLQPIMFEQWYVDSEHQIIWEPGETDVEPTVSLRLSLDDGQTFPHVIASDIPNTGSLNWRIPDLPSKQCRIQIVYSDSMNTGAGTFAILRKPVPVQRTFEGGEWPSWRSERVAFMSDRAGNYDVYVLAGNGVIQVTTDPGLDGYPSFDSKGFHLAFTSDRTGRNEIWATDLDTIRYFSGLAQLTSGGGSQPAWRQQPRAQRLVFISVTPRDNILVPNLSTLILREGLMSGLNATNVRLRADSGDKERPTWVESLGHQFITTSSRGWARATSGAFASKIQPKILRKMSSCLFPPI